MKTPSKGASTPTGGDGENPEKVPRKKKTTNKATERPPKPEPPERQMKWDAAVLDKLVVEFSELDTRDAEQSLLALKLIAEMSVRGFECDGEKGVKLVRTPDTAIRAIEAMATVRDKMPKAPPVFVVEVNLAEPEYGENGELLKGDKWG